MRLPGHEIDDLGVVNYTNAGQADADLTSAAMALEAVLERRDLTGGLIRWIAVPPASSSTSRRR